MEAPELYTSSRPSPQPSRYLLARTKVGPSSLSHKNRQHHCPPRIDARINDDVREQFSFEQELILNPAGFYCFSEPHATVSGPPHVQPWWLAAEVTSGAECLRFKCDVSVDAYAEAADCLPGGSSR